MKRISFIFLLAMATIVTLVSCDSKKSEVKSLAKQFVTALNEKDRPTVYEMYPAAKQLMDFLPENLETSGMKVEVDDSTGVYTVTLNSEREQRIAFIADSLGKFKIKDSYGVLVFDSIGREFAVRAGIPVKQMSDREYADIMNEDSMFMSNLNMKFFDEIHGNLVKQTAYWHYGRESGNWFMRVFQTIKNKGDVTVKGEDYNIEFKLTDTKDWVSTTKDVPGVDLAPGETHEFMTDAPAFYNAADNKRLMIDIIIRFKNMSMPAMLLKYAKLTGEEYQEYLQTLKELEEIRKNGPKVDEDAELPDDFDSLPDED